MRGIWSPTARPKLGCNYAPRDSTSSVLSKRTTTLRLRRRLKFSDAFPVIIAPVLGAALIADTSWKDKRRKEWVQQLAAINEEIEQLHVQEVQAWSRLQIRSARLGARHQMRSYSTMSAALQEKEEDDELFEIAEDDHAVWPNQEMDTKPKNEAKDDSLVWEPTEDIPPTSAELIALTNFERLVSIKLALEMILQVHIGHSFRFIDPPSTYQLEANSLPDDVNGISRKLKSVKLRLSQLQPPKVTWNSYRRTNSNPEKIRLQNELNDIAQKFKSGALTVPQFTAAFAYQVFASQETPAVQNYTNLIKIFSEADMGKFASLVIAALRKAKTPLDDSAVAQLLLQFARSKDLEQLDRMMKDLTRSEGMFNVIQKWEWWRINGSRIAVPISQDPRLLQSMVLLSLKCNQPDQAEAYASLLQDKEYGGQWKGHVFKSFLNYYASKLNWNKGKQWIQTIIEWAPSISRGGEAQLRMFSTLIFRMLDLCVACDRRADYQRIMEASIACGFNRPVHDDLKAPMYSWRARNILDDWSKSFQSRGDPRSDLQNGDKGAQFRDTLAPHYGRPTEQSKPTKVSQRNGRETSETQPSENIGSDLMQTIKQQEAALIQLQKQLSQSKALHSDLQEANKALSATQAKRQAEIERELEEMRTQRLMFAKAQRQDKQARVEQDAAIQTLQEELAASQQIIKSYAERNSQLDQMQKDILRLATLVTKSTASSAPKTDGVLALKANQIEKLPTAVDTKKSQSRFESILPSSSDPREAELEELESPPQVPPFRDGYVSYTPPATQKYFPPTTNMILQSHRAFSSSAAGIPQLPSPAPTLPLPSPVSASSSSPSVPPTQRQIPPSDPDDLQPDIKRCKIKSSSTGPNIYRVPDRTSAKIMRQMDPNKFVVRCVYFDPQGTRS